MIWHFLLYAAKSNPTYRIRQMPKSLMNVGRGEWELLGCWQMTAMRRMRGDIVYSMSLISRDYYTKIVNNGL